MNCGDEACQVAQRRTLRWALAINAAMFFVEFTAGWLAQSTGLVADSLDMLADTLVYGMGLYAVGRSPMHMARAAAMSGALQFLLAGMVVTDVVRRFVVGSEPDGLWMMGVASLALGANVATLLLLAAERRGEIHMRAMWICTNNDVLVNAGVILSGGLVLLIGSALPDLAIGIFVSLLVLRGAVRILREARHEAQAIRAGAANGAALTDGTPPESRTGTGAGP
jgi:cation diffusion facilitator family transporter